MDPGPGSLCKVDGLRQGFCGCYAHTHAHTGSYTHTHTLTLTPTHPHSGKNPRLAAWRPLNQGGGSPRDRPPLGRGEAFREETEISSDFIREQKITAAEHVGENSDEERWKASLLPWVHPVPPTRPVSTWGPASSPCPKPL